MSVDVRAHAVDARLREASRLAGPLLPEARLEAKLDLSGRGVASRLQEASDLLDLCRKLASRKSQPQSESTASPGLPVVRRL